MKPNSILLVLWGPLLCSVTGAVAVWFDYRLDWPMRLMFSVVFAAMAWLCAVMLKALSE